MADDKYPKGAESGYLEGEGKEQVQLTVKLIQSNGQI